MTQGVLVSVSTVEYTRILVSDCIGACPYRPFSNVTAKQFQHKQSQKGAKFTHKIHKTAMDFNETIHAPAITH